MPNIVKIAGVLLAICVVAGVSFLSSPIVKADNAPQSSAGTPPATPPGAAAPAQPAAVTPAPVVQSFAQAWGNQHPDQKTQSLGFVIGTFVVAALLLWVADKSEILRDSDPPDFGGAKTKDGKKPVRPFSLALTQMGWWFLIVLSAFVYLYLVKGVPTLSGQALILMGIGTGTALGAAMVKNTKDTDPNVTALANVQDQIRALNPPPDPAALILLTAQRDALVVKLASKGILIDILTDANGISLHRFQSFAWTLVLGVVFLLEVAVHRAMPSYDPNLLALLGVSGGAYLGFKIPEQPT